MDNGKLKMEDRVEMHGLESGGIIFSILVADIGIPGDMGIVDKPLCCIVIGLCARHYQAQKATACDRE